MTVVIMPYDPAWPGRYVAEAARIADAVGADRIDLHHIGSTSVPGLAAKPIIDILGEVAALEEIETRADRLQAIGYEAKGPYGVPGRRFFRKFDGQGERSHHLHVFARGAADVTRLLALRDFLRSFRDRAVAYAEFKRALAGLPGQTRAAYQAGKRGFVDALERDALDWRAG